MRIADSNSMCPLLHAALGDSDYSCFQAILDEVVLYGSVTEWSSATTKVARTRMMPDTDALTPSPPSNNSLGSTQLIHNGFAEDEVGRKLCPHLMRRQRVWSPHQEEAMLCPYLSDHPVDQFAQLRGH